MPDLEHLPFDRARVAAAVRPVPLRDLHARARRRRQRRTAAVAFAAVLVVAVAGAAFAYNPPQQRPAVPAPSSHPSSGTMPTDLAVLSEDVAVAFWSGCPAHFSHTTSGGWTEPVAAPACDTGERDERWQVLDSRTYLYFLNGTGHVTTDGGRTWMPAGAALTDVAALPGVARAADCGAHSRCFGAHGEGPYAADSGVAYRLAKGPPGRSIGRYQQAGGVLWATLYGGSSGTGEVGWTADGGATWKSKPLDVHFGADNVAALDDKRAWVSFTPEIGQPQHILRTADGGTTWQDVTTDLPVTANERDLTVRADGALLMVEPDPFAVWVSTDNGKHFVVNPGPPVDRDSLRMGSGPGIAWAMWGNPVQLSVTTDGRTWTQMPPP
ncbi:WD40/YVTN/BNR-like repeat-containing protein [Dactylosporangium sp. CS-033363]|uniref:WD40/YVTN/BNR-like repeat-containing protein n=1 Tax=Dactylosporangium sp. CS-033363 TaxID=3239935 RepID=UPI003D8B9065